MPIAFLLSFLEIVSVSISVFQPRTLDFAKNASAYSIRLVATCPVGLVRIDIPLQVSARLYPQGVDSDTFARCSVSRGVEHRRSYRISGGTVRDQLN